MYNSVILFIHQLSFMEKMSLEKETEALHIRKHKLGLWVLGIKIQV